MMTPIPSLERSFIAISSVPFLSSCYLRLWGFNYNFHTQNEEEESAEQPLPMYHVLEGPTPIESEPDTQEVCVVFIHIKLLASLSQT